MKTLITAIFAAGVSLTALSSAQAITAAPLTEAAKETSSVVEVQRGTNASRRLQARLQDDPQWMPQGKLVVIFRVAEVVWPFGTLTETSCSLSRQCFSRDKERSGQAGFARALLRTGGANQYVINLDFSGHCSLGNSQVFSLPIINIGLRPPARAAVGARRSTREPR